MITNAIENSLNYRYLCFQPITTLQISNLNEMNAGIHTRPRGKRTQNSAPEKHYE